MTTGIDLEQYVGHYRMMPELIISVQRRGDMLLAAFPGVPAGFEIRMEPLDAPHTFAMRGGPLPNATAVFADDSISIAGRTLQRITPGPADLAAVHPRLLPPPMQLSAPQRAAFAAFWSRLQAAGGAHVDYDLPYPLHEFLRYLADRDEIIFHGSGNPDIEEFRPVRTSYELNDPTGRGNLQAVYGTHDGLWPLFFAVVDRGRLSGAIRNGVTYFENDAGEQIATYSFSINATDLPQQPWRTGTLYILPRATFRRLEVLPGVLANEWASEAPVRPLARLTVRPEDFPFLDQIAGHDDSALVRFGALLDGLLDATTAAALADETLQLTLNWTADLGADLLTLIDLARSQLPTAQFTLRFPPHLAAPELIVAAPLAFLQTLRPRLHRRQLL